MMQIIPVIDLLNGVVVHAKKGERQHYQAIQSTLTKSCQAPDIIHALLELHPFEQLYIADLNAIQKLGSTYNANYNVIAEIAHQFPKLKLWVDAGISKQSELDFWQKLNVKLILGSENFLRLADFITLNTPANIALSLDFLPHGYQGPAELLSSSAYWPKDVIVMSLSHVGANAGFNTPLLTTILAQSSNHHIYIAGGIRHTEDLLALKAMGVSGALLATALHQQQITAAQLNQLT